VVVRGEYILLVASSLSTVSMNQGSDRVLSTPLKSRIPDLRVKINHLLSYKGSRWGSICWCRNDHRFNV